MLCSVSVLGKVWFELTLQGVQRGGLTLSQGVFTVSEDLILSGTLMDCIVSSVGGSSYMEVSMGFADL